jgi:hypothetical protein
MEITILERLRKNPCEVISKVKANNIIFNVKSKFESNSSLNELLFRISEQKIIKTVHEKTADGTFAIPSNE